MHITQIVRTEQQSDEAIAVTIRCCNNPKTDGTITIYGVQGLTHEQFEAKVSAHHDKVASKCGGMQKAQGHLATLVTQTKEHK